MRPRYSNSYCLISTSFFLHDPNISSFYYSSPAVCHLGTCSRNRAVLLFFEIEFRMFLSFFLFSFQEFKIQIKRISSFGELFKNFQLIFMKCRHEFVFYVSW